MTDPVMKCRSPPVRSDFRRDQVECRRAREHIQEGGDHLLAGYVGDGDGNPALAVRYQEDRLVVHGGN